MRTQLRSAVLAATGLLVVTVGPVSSAPTLAPRLFDTESTIRSYAADQGVSVGVAASRLAYQRPAGEFQAVVAAREAAVFGGLWIEHAPVFRVVVGVTDPAAVPRVLALAGSLREVLDVRVVRRTTAELDRAAAEARAAVEEAGFLVASETDVTRNRVLLSVSDRAAVEAALARADVRLPSFVAFDEVPELGVPEVDIYAGQAISACTSGYTVRNATGTNGVTTAGHCSNTQSRSGTNLPFQGERFNGDTDAQWHTAPGFTVRAWAHDGLVEPTESSYRSVRAVIGRDNQPVGGYVCKYGATTFYTCGFIQSRTFEPQDTTVPNSTATYIRVHRDGVNLSEGGDSGGPWYFGAEAYGIHTCGIGDDACYTAVNFVQAALGVTVLTVANTRIGSRLNSNVNMYPYDYMVSPDGRFVARMQNDGNFVLYAPGNRAVWSTRTVSGPNAGATARMQNDGNFVLYRPGNGVMWETNTDGRWGAYLDLQNDCNLVVYQPTATGGRIAVWKSNTIYGVNC